MSMNIIPMGGAFPNHRVDWTTPGLSTGAPVGGGPASGIHDGVPFATLFRNAIQNAEDTHAVARADSVALALGEIYDIGQMNVNSARAGLAFELLVQIRNRVLEAYQEMMRMTV